MRKVVGFYTDAEGKKRPITENYGLPKKFVVINPRKPRLPKPSWRLRPAYVMQGKTVFAGVYNKVKNRVYPIMPVREGTAEQLRSGYLSRNVWMDKKRKKLRVLTAPELLPSKLEQRKEIADKINGGTVVEVFAGKGNLSKEVWSKKADQLILVDEDGTALREADAKLRGVKKQIIHDNNVNWLKNLNPDALGDVRVVDFDAFGSPAEQIRLFFERYPVRKPMYVCVTDGIHMLVSVNKQKGQEFMEKNYGVDFIVRTREDVVKSLDVLMSKLAQKHGFKVEPINMGYGKMHVVYAAYKVRPL